MLHTWNIIFPKAWQLQRAYIKAMASIGNDKTNRAKRIPVIQDTTTFKEWEARAEDGKDPLARRKNTLSKFTVDLFLRRLVTDTPVDVMHLNAERVRVTLLQFMGWLCTGQHLDQLTLAEFVSVGAHQILTNIDMETEAKNTVVIEAKKMANCTVEEDDDELAEDDAPKVQFEDVGGQWDEDADGRLEEKEASMGLQSERIYDWNEIKGLL